MARINEYLIQKDNETLDSFDRRISGLPYQHIGYAFFECSNYNQEKHIFALYIVWNQRINSLLEDMLPPSGFQLRCSSTMAECISFENSAVPVFGKLSSTDGVINVTDMIIRYFDRNYVVSYTGINTNVPDNIVFKSIPELNEKEYDFILKSASVMNSSFPHDINRKDTNSSYTTSFNVADFTIKNFKASSFYNKFITSFNAGSFNLSSFKAGSFNIGSFNMGSYYAGSYKGTLLNIGSFNWGSFNLSSFNISSFNQGTFNISSFNISSFNFGSFNLNLLKNISGSFRNILLDTGSFFASSFNKSYLLNSSFNKNFFNSGSFSAGSYKNGLIGSFNINVLSDEYINTSKEDSFPYESLLKEIFGIGLMGYGLNLI